MPELLHRLKNLTLFGRLSQRELLQLRQDVNMRQFTNKQTLYAQGDEQKNIFLILTGGVRVQTNLDNLNTVVLGFLGRGDFLGIETLWCTQEHYPHAAVCNENVTALEIPVAIFKERFLSVPKIHDEVLHQFSRRFLELQMDICLSHSLTSYRVAQFLLRLLKKQPEALGGRIQIPLNRIHIAQKVSSQNETVTRILSEWTKQKWIATFEHHIEILDRKALEAIPSHRPSKIRTRRRRNR